MERLASDVIELSTRHNFAHYVAVGTILGGGARRVSGNTTEGIAWIEDAIRNYQATGAMLAVPFYLSLKAEALYLSDRTSEALEAIQERLNGRTKQRRFGKPHSRSCSTTFASMKPLAPVTRIRSLGGTIYFAFMAGAPD